MNANNRYFPDKTEARGEVWASWHLRSCSAWSWSRTAWPADDLHDSHVHWIGPGLDSMLAHPALVVESNDGRDHRLSSRW